MKAKLQKVKVPIKEIHHLEYLLLTHGLSNFSIYYKNRNRYAILTFTDQMDYSVFILLGLLSQTQEVTSISDYAFMEKLEKKLGSYSKFDHIHS